MRTRYKKAPAIHSERVDRINDRINDRILYEKYKELFYGINNED